ncbi:MAG: alkyl/aryl-sulfatase [Opitutales bacterium]|nr:alkyl/aryl-sulfatase [Opitutales bacterium]
MRSSGRSTALLYTLTLAIALTALPLYAQQSPATKRLLERNKMFENQIIKVADNVYTAIGYQVTANSMIVGDDGVIIIDPGQLPLFASRVRKAFEEITDKPVKAIIYTHSHGDHINGAPAFFEEGKGIEVWARSNFGSEVARNQITGLLAGVRASNTQGFDLKPEQKIGVGVAIPPARRPAGNLNVDGGNRAGRNGQAQAQRPTNGRGQFMRIDPTQNFSEDRKRIEISGVTLDLISAPGETADQLYVWLPDRRIVFAGDNFYQSWPNVYPLRGTARRSIRDWISSIDSMVQEAPMHLVGGHTTPMLNNATEVLTNYRDAMQWVYDRTIEGAKQYMTPDELVKYAALPEKYAKLDYLGSYYGSVEGTIRDIYAQDLGWFDGDPLNLHRESPKKQSQRMADLVGGVDKLMTKAREAMEAADYIGAAQLVQHIIRLRPENKGAKRLMGEALAIIGERTFNAPMRNYTISSSNRYLKEAEE